MFYALLKETNSGIYFYSLDLILTTLDYYYYYLLLL